MDYYKRYMGDYGRDTSRLSMMEHGAYNLLLDDYYSTRQPLPADLDDLNRICRATTKPEQAAVAAVAKRFFPVAGDGLRHNNRADEEIAKWEEMAHENRERGKLGGRPKKNPNGNPGGNPSGSSGDNPEETRTETARVIPGLQKGPFSKPAENPLQLLSQKPKPEPEPDSGDAHAREEPRNKGQPPNGHAMEADSWPYEQRIQAAYPKGRNTSNLPLAMHHANRLVGLGLTTWPELADTVEAYARRYAVNGDEVNIAAHNFFDPKNEHRHWAQRYEVPPAKAPYIPAPTTEQIEAEIAAGLRDENGSRIHP